VNKRREENCEDETKDEKVCDRDRRRVNIEERQKAREKEEEVVFATYFMSKEEPAVFFIKEVRDDG